MSFEPIHRGSSPTKANKMRVALSVRPDPRGNDYRQANFYVSKKVAEAIGVRPGGPARFAVEVGRHVDAGLVRLCASDDGGYRPCTQGGRRLNSYEIRISAAHLDDPVTGWRVPPHKVSDCKIVNMDCNSREVLILLPEWARPRAVERIEDHRVAG